MSPTKNDEKNMNLLGIFFGVFVWASILGSLLFFFSGKIATPQEVSQVRLFLGTPVVPSDIALESKEPVAAEQPETEALLSEPLALELVPAAVPVEPKEAEVKPPIPVQKPAPAPVANKAPSAAASAVTKAPKTPTVPNTKTDAKKNQPKAVEKNTAPLATVLPSASMVVVPEAQAKPQVLSPSPDEHPLLSSQGAAPAEKAKKTPIPLVLDTSVDAFDSLAAARSDVSGTTTAQSAAAPSSSEPALRRVSKTWTREGYSSGVSYQTVLTVIDGKDGGLKIQFKEGVSRRLLSPLEPVIVLSQNAENLIENTKTLIIQFKVLSLGSVSVQDIAFSPAKVLPEEVLAEIKAQLSQWSFEPAGSSGQVALQYSIKKL